jgi:HEAT repeat protein
MPEVSFGKNFRISTTSISSQDDFDKKFREGRDLIDQEDWVKAAEKFAEITDKYPKNKSTDAALYWLAFCYKKQKNLKEAGAAADRLIKNFPNSSWVEDAKVLLLEVTNQSRSTLGQNSLKESGKSLEAMAKSLDAMAKSLDDYGQSLDEYTKTMTAVLALDGVSLEREDEIKLATFQNLLTVDIKKAIEIAGELLRDNSKTSETLKRQIVRAFRHSRFVKIQTAGTGSEYVRTTTVIGKEFVPLLRETLKKSLQNESNVKVRIEIIFTLADIDDAQSIEYLVQLYSSTTDKEIKKTIIYSFGSSMISFSGTFKGIKINAVPSNAADSKNIYIEKLLEIIRAEKDSDLRRAAFSTLQRFVNWSAKDETVKMFSQIYDAETDERFKISIINYFGNLKNKQATAKLMDIAKNDTNEDLRFLAIYALKRNKTPEVIKFLESLIK